LAGLYAVGRCNQSKSDKYQSSKFLCKSLQFAAESGIWPQLRECVKLERKICVCSQEINTWIFHNRLGFYFSRGV